MVTAGGSLRATTSNAGRVWFRMFPETREVRMLWVEVTKPDNVDWEDDWEIPF